MSADLLVELVRRQVAHAIETGSNTRHTGLVKRVDQIGPVQVRRDAGFFVGAAETVEQENRSAALRIPEDHRMFEPDDAFDGVDQDFR